MKLDKFGIKVWLLADADTYYVPRFQLYLGKNRQQTRTNNELLRQKGLGFFVVWTLGETYLDDCRHFFFENSSVQPISCSLCGRVRMNRRDFPTDLKQMTLVCDEIRARQSGNHVATMWKDKRVVTLLSTTLLQILKSVLLSSVYVDEGSTLGHQKR